MAVEGVESGIMSSLPVTVELAINSVVLPYPGPDVAPPLGDPIVGL